MARYKLSTGIVTILSFLQIIHGQNNPTGGQNLSQALTNKAGIKSANENLLQNDNVSKGFNFNNVGQYNSQQSQLSPTLQQSFPLQQIPNVQQNQPLSLSQNLTPLVNQQQNQLSELQIPIPYQSLNIPQSSYVQQPLFKDTSRSIVPVIQQASVQSVNTQPLIANNYQQVPISSMIKQIPIQVSQALPTSNSYLPTFSSIPPVSNFGSQCAGFIPNLENNYARAFAASPISEAQIIKSYPVQYQAGLPNSNLSVLGKNVIPYQNQALSIPNSALDIQNNIAANNEFIETDNFTSLLLSLMKTPKSTTYPQYNNAFRVLMGLPRYCSASGMFAAACTDSFSTILRKRCASLMLRMRGSTNGILSALADRWDSPMLWRWMKMHAHINII